jgi:ribosomal protein L37E
MNIGALFIGFALLILAVPYVVDPFRPQRHQLFSKKRPGRTEAENKSIDALFALRDLEFDYKTEKIIEEDFKRIRANLLGQAADDIETRRVEDAHIENMIRARQEIQATQISCLRCGKQLQDQDKFCSSCGIVRSIRCANCGLENQLDDNFCTQCGNKLNVYIFQT